MQRVILVDDHPAIRLAVQTTLEQSERFTVINEYDDGLDALEAVQQRPVELMIIDLDIPGLSGLELIQKVREINSEVKLLILSGQEEVNYIVRAVKLGANGYVSKSRDLSIVMAAADALMSGYDYFPNGTLQATLKMRGTAQVTVNPAQKAATLTERELEVLQMLASGLSNKEISEQLFISNKTISTYKIKVLKKLGLNSIAELIEFAHKHDLI